MGTILIVKIIIFIGAIIASRLIVRRIPKFLSEFEMELVAEKAAPMSKWRNFLIYGTAILMFVLGRVDPIMLDKIQPFLLGVFILGMSLLVYFSYRMFNKLNLPRKAGNLYISSIFVFFAGVAVLILPIG